MKLAFIFRIMIFILAFSIGVRLHGQSPYYEWVKAIGGANFDIGNAIAVDPKTKDVYTAGVFSRTVDFDPGNNVFTLTAVKGNDIFISKSSQSGHFIWALSIGGRLNDFAFSIAIDPLGNAFVTGQFADTVDFDPGAGEFKLISKGSSDIYVLKIDGGGNFIWAKSLGDIGYDVVKSLAVDPGTGDVYIKGEFNGTVDFDPGPNTYELENRSSGNGVFISKLDASGNFIWAHVLDVAPFGGSMGVAPYGGFANSIIVDSSGNIYTTGWFQGTADFDPGENAYYLTATGVKDIFILKLDAFGKFVWARCMRGTHQSLGHSVAVDASGNVYTSGMFQGTVDFDPGRRVFKIAAHGIVYGDIFISKLDSQGNFIWAKGFGGYGGDSGNSIAVDPKTEDIYATGIFTGTGDFDPGKGIFNLTSAGDLDVFISKLDAFGNFSWAKSIGGIHVDYGYSIVLDGSDHIHVIGGFTGPSLSFGPITLPGVDSTGNVLDIFIAKLNVSPPVFTDEISTEPVDVYPNPTKGELNIKFNDIEFSDAKVAVVDLQGKVVYSSINKNISQELTIDISSLPAANYLIAIDRNGTRMMKQVVKVQD